MTRLISFFFHSVTAASTDRLRANTARLARSCHGSLLLLVVDLHILIHLRLAVSVGPYNSRMRLELGFEQQIQLHELGDGSESAVVLPELVAPGCAQAFELLEAGELVLDQRSNNGM
jgi:hypothetical protein